MHVLPLSIKAYLVGRIMLAESDSAGCETVVLPFASFAQLNVFHFRSPDFFHNGLTSLTGLTE